MYISNHFTQAAGPSRRCRRRPSRLHVPFQAFISRLLLLLYYYQLTPLTHNFIFQSRWGFGFWALGLWGRRGKMDFCAAGDRWQLAPCQLLLETATTVPLLRLGETEVQGVRCASSPLRLGEACKLERAGL